MQAESGKSKIAFDEFFLLALEQQRQSASARARQEHYVAMLNPLPGERVLDLGCGSGAFCRMLGPLVAPRGRVIGIDRAQQAIALARRLSPAAQQGVVVYEWADGHHLPFADGSFDAAVCMSVLSFCEDASRVLAELRRVLCPGGRLLVANADEDTRIYTGHDRDLGRRIMLTIADRGHDPWLARRLAYLLRSAGLQLIEEAVVADVERHFTPGSSGYTLAHAFRAYLLNSGISEQEYQRWLADLRACEWEGSYCYGVTTFAYLAGR